jgi:hypothetical protein
LPVPVLDREATCWCLSGAIDRRVPDAARGAVYEAFNRALGCTGIRDACCIQNWNDQLERTVEEVIDLCDKVAQS